jgi:hypothetical protein
MCCRASSSELIHVMPVDWFPANGFSWDRVHHTSIQFHISWFSSRMWIMLGQVVSGYYLSSSKWQWTDSVNVSWLRSSQWIQLGKSATGYYARSFQFIQFQDVYNVRKSCIRRLFELKQVTVNWFSSHSGFISSQWIKLGHAASWYLLLCKFIPVDLDSGCALCWDKYLYHESISDQSSESEIIQFMPVDSFPANWFSWNKMYQNSMHVHSSWFSPARGICFD